jgi:hypothetical protein
MADTTGATAPSTIEQAFQAYLEHGDHPEVQVFESLIGGAGKSQQWGHPSNVWDFIHDAVEGAGGFATGSYLYPFRMEVQQEVPGRALAIDKYTERRALAEYDGFPGDICNAPIDLIASKSDLVKRSISDKAAEDWTQDVDGRGRTLGEFMETVLREARKYGVALAVVDRPAFENSSLAADQAPENRPYPYVIPTRNVRWWMFDERGVELLALVICYPDDADMGADRAPGKCPMQVWTAEGWGIFEPIEGQDPRTMAGWRLTKSAPLALGRIPVVRVPNDRPPAGRLGVGQTEMLKVARMGQVVYNMDSEAREIERKAAAPIFVIPVKDSKNFNEGAALVIGVDSALTYDGDAGAPQYIQPNLDVLERFEMRRTSKISASYKMANLDALGGGGSTSKDSAAPATSSGYHAEVVFSKTERRISRYAGNVEAAERELVALVMQWLGTDRDTALAAIEISYPREFGIRDLDHLLDRTIKELDFIQGEAAQREILDEYFQAKFPRKTPTERAAMVDSEMKKRASLKAQIQKAAADAKASLDKSQAKAVTASITKGT